MAHRILSILGGFALVAFGATLWGVVSTAFPYADIPSNARGYALILVAYGTPLAIACAGLYTLTISTK